MQFHVIWSSFLFFLFYSPPPIPFLVNWDEKDELKARLLTIIIFSGSNFQVFEMSRQLHSTILPMSKAVLLLILIFIDSFITMYTIAAMRFEYVGFLKMLFLHSYNVLVLLFYIFLELYKVTTWLSGPFLVQPVA